MAKNFTGYHLKKGTLQHGRQIEHSNDWQVNFFLLTGKIFIFCTIYFCYVAIKTQCSPPSVQHSCCHLGHIYVA